jgi:uncharacterized Zn-finger protein
LILLASVCKQSKTPPPVNHELILIVCVCYALQADVGIDFGAEDFAKFSSEGNVEEDVDDNGESSEVSESAEVSVVNDGTSADDRQDLCQCQECSKCFDSVNELILHVQQNHVVKRSTTKLKTEKKSNVKSVVKISAAASRSQAPVRRVYSCSKCECEMTAAQFNETGMCTSCLVKMELEVICEDSSLMMTCESFCHTVSSENGSDVENIMDGEAFDENADKQDEPQTEDDTDIQNVQLEEMSAGSMFDVSNITEAYAKIGVDKNAKYRCLLCAKEFVRHKTVVKHMLTHVDVKNKCAMCDKEFEQVDELEEHVMTHMLAQSTEEDYEEGSSQAVDSDGNRYACGQCGKQFRHRASLFRHVETHVENLRFDCKECGKTYRHRADFQQHMRLKHLLKNRAVCRYCDRQFYLPGSLRAHLHTHRAEKSYKCRICGKVYQRSDSLNNHMLVHTGESPYMCTQCGEQFKHRLSMYRHLDSHKDRESFRCELCARCFKHSNALKEHTKRFHGSDLIVLSQQPDVSGLE